MGAVKFGSVCSGIEAASVAWNPIGWEAAWLSEIEPFPSAVLRHHYPDVPNLGDMTLLPARISSGEVEAPDVFCGGTTCQAFSVAGLRKSLDDKRGNLSLTFCEIANEIDTARSIQGRRPAIIFWENVPGVLSTKDNAFGCFLAGLAGEDEALEPPGGKWTNAGCVFGPKRAVAWRVLDAQYFGVAQRRRRVFVVASARNDFDPAAVLFEFDGLRRDIAPSREAGKATSGSTGSGSPFGGMSPVAGTLTANTGGMTRPAGNANELDFCVPVQTFDFQSSGSYGDSPVAATLSARDYKSAKDLAVQPIDAIAIGWDEELNASVEQSGTLLRGGQGGRRDGVMTPAMAVRRLTPVECERLQGFPDIKKTYTIQVCHEAEKTVNAQSAEQSSAAPSHDQSKHAVVHVQINLERQEVQLLSPAKLSLCASTAASQNSSRRLMQSADIAHLVALMTPHLDLLTGVGKAASQANTTGFSLHQSGSKSVQLSGQEIAGLASDADKFTKTVSGCLKSITSEAGQSSQSYEQNIQTLCCCVVAAISSCIPDGMSPKSSFALSIETSIGYTAIPWRKKPSSDCPDGPRYKALGNSWAVPVVRWIGERIDACL